MSEENSALLPRPSDDVGAARWLMFFSVGMFPWLLVNGIFVELAVFNKILPEGIELSSQAGAITQIANVGLLYVWLRDRYKNSRWLSLSYTIWALLGLCFVSCMILCFAWDVTVGGVSVVLLSTTFTGGLVGIIGLTVIYPWVSEFPPGATSAVSTGTASSGVIAGVIGLVQGAGAEKQTFSPFVFMLSMTTITIVSAVFFHILDRERNEKVVKSAPLLERGIQEGEADRETEKGNLEGWLNALKAAKMPVAVQFFNCLFNYAYVPGIVPYLLCGNTPTFWLQEANTIANVLGRWASTFFNRTDRLLPLLAAGMGIVLGMSFFQGVSLQKNTLSQRISSYAGAFLFGLLNGYIETLVFLVPGRTIRDQRIKEKALQLVIIVGQIGAFTGTFTTAALVSKQIFHQC